MSSSASSPLAHFRLELPGGLVVVPMQAHHAQQCQELQDVVFPTLAPEQRLRAEHYRYHVTELFPEGQFVTLDGERVVGATTAIRMDFDFDHIHHRFEDTLAGGWLTTHEPGGAWLYGIDVGVHPEYRRRGIARALYAARHATVKALGLRGQITAGMMSGYGAVASQMTGEQYYAELLSGQRTDPTVSAQLRIGFELRGLIPEYLDDPVCGNYGVLIVLDAAKPVL